MDLAASLATKVVAQSAGRGQACQGTVKTTGEGVDGSGHLSQWLMPGKCSSEHLLLARAHTCDGEEGQARKSPAGNRMPFFPSDPPPS